MRKKNVTQKEQVFLNVGHLCELMNKPLKKEKMCFEEPFFFEFQLDFNKTIFVHVH